MLAGYGEWILGRQMSFGVMLASILMCAPSFAKNYGYSDGVPFHLGNGFNPLDLSEPYPSCFLNAAEVRFDGEGARDATVVIRAIKNREELFRELGASIEVNAQVFFGGAKSSTNYFDQIEFFEDGLTWVVLGKVNYGRFALKNPELLPKYQKMIDESRFADFAAACGTHYFAAESRGAAVFAIYTLKNLSTAQKTRVTSMLQAGVSGFGFSANLDAEFKSVLMHASRSSQMEFRVLALGGGGIVQLANLATDAGDIRKVQESIRDYMRTMTVEKSVPLSYMSASMSQAGYKDASPLQSEKRDRVLAQYYLILSEGWQIANRLFHIIGRLNGAMRRPSDVDTAQYKSLYASLTRDLEILHADANRCYENARDCIFPKTILPYVSWPTEDAEGNTSILLQPSRIPDKCRPADLSSPMPLQDDEICEQERVRIFKARYINEREYFELKALRAEPLCGAGGVLRAIRYCT